VVVGIETDRGPWVQALIAAGYQMYAINPLQVARYRQRHAVSGPKSDACDRHALADMVRTDRHQLRPVAGDSATAEAVKVVARIPDADLGTHSSHDTIRLQPTWRRLASLRRATCKTAPQWRRRRPLGRSASRHRISL